jgi:hypothetical protein
MYGGVALEVTFYSETEIITKAPAKPAATYVLTVVVGNRSVSLSFSPGAVEPARPTLNLQQIALQKWTTYRTKIEELEGVQLLTVYTGPTVWVAGGNGFIAATVPPANSPAGISLPCLPLALAHDGGHIWIGCDNGLVTKFFLYFRPYSDQPLPTIQLPGRITSLVFDGHDIWAALPDSNSIAKIAYNAKTFTTYGGFSAPWSLAFDGANLWVSNSGGNTVSKVQISDASVLSNITVGQGPKGFVFDGANMWVAVAGNGTVAKVSANDGSVTSYTVGVSPTALACDGNSIWVVDSSDNGFRQISLSGRHLVTHFLQGPTSVAFDGVNIWVTESSGRISKF